MTLVAYNDPHIVSKLSYGNVFASGVGTEARTIREQLYEAIIHYETPYSRQQESIYKFFNLAATWKEEIKLISSITEIALNPSYQEIIGMGTKVIPLILMELQNEPDYWFWALKAITGADPVGPDQRGDLGQMTQAWLEWGKENGYP